MLANRSCKRPFIRTVERKNPLEDILVVDDDQDTRDVIVSALTSAGYGVQTAQNGQDALEQLTAMRPRQPRLVLLDIEMPEMSGTELLRELSAHGVVPTLPVIVISSKAEEAKGLNARMLIRKPITMQLLLSVVRDVCSASIE